MNRIKAFFGAVMLVVATLAVSGPAQALSLIRDAEIEGTLRRISTPIFQEAGLSPESVDIFIIRDNRLNAFVGGGRRMFLNTGLMIELETSEELLGVIAHEAAHIAGGHEARRRLDARNAQGPALLGLLIGIAAGVAGSPEVGAAASAGSQEIARRFFLRNTRAQEASADQAGLNYLVRAGIDPEGLLKVLRRFRGQEVLQIGNVDPYVLTHPLGTQRMSLLQRRVAEIGDRDWKVDPDREYWHARLRAKLEGFLVRPARVLDRLEGKPETEFTLLTKAVALREIEPRAATALMDKLIAKRPNDPYYAELKGQILLESGNADAALPYYRKAVKLAPNEPLLKSGLGRALLQRNTPAQNAEALQVLKDARTDDLADVAALRDLATAYSRAGDQGMATLATAERYALVGDAESAVSLAKRASKILPNGSPGWLRAQDILKMKPPED